MKMLAILGQQAEGICPSVFLSCFSPLYFAVLIRTIRYQFLFIPISSPNKQLSNQIESNSSCQSQSQDDQAITQLENTSQKSSADLRL